MFAKIPETKNIVRNFLPPTKRSRIDPKSRSAKELYAKCPNPPWRKIAEMNLQSCWNAREFRMNKSVKLGIKICAKKINISIPVSFTA